MNCFGLIKFVTGILLALALLFVGGAAAARYLITRLTTLPPKPVFVEEQAAQNPDSPSVDDMAAADPVVIDEEAVVFDDLEPRESSEDGATEVTAPDQVAEAETSEPDVTEPETIVSEVPELEVPNPELEEAETPAPEQPNARITQPIGMVLRQGPSQDTTRIGGLYYNDEIIVIGESADGQWQQVRLPGSGVEGWIKAGNTARMD